MSPSAQSMTARDQRLVYTFLQVIARMETEEEINARTDDDGMSGDDACATLSALITEARRLLVQS